jgi:hypothetical protein
MTKPGFSRSISRMLLSTTLALGTVISAWADGGAPPAGKYNCMKISSSGSLMSLGTLEIKGSKYRGIGDEGDYAAYSVDSNGGITWSGGLTGMPDGWTVTSSKYVGADPNGHPMIKIHYTSPRGALEVMDCVQEN